MINNYTNGNIDQKEQYSILETERMREKRNTHHTLTINHNNILGSNQSTHSNAYNMYNNTNSTVFSTYY